MELFWLWLPVLGSAIIAGSATSRPVDQDQRMSPEDEQLAEGYLKRFYNMKPSRGNASVSRRRRSLPALEEKIREMQQFFGLKETGRLDPETLKMMKKARCGVPDVENYSFFPNRPKWRKNTITYEIAKYMSGMSRADQDRSFLSAVKMWSDATPLKFTKVDRGPADIVLTFARRSHGDFYPFDGPGGVLAHAFQPGQGIGGDVHFDEDETWTNGRRGYNLLAVAAHELGHSLGLSHSRDPSAIMFPNYRSRSSTQYSLSRDDVLGIQSLYGKPTSGAGATPRPNNCDSVSLDAALMMGSDLVFFKNGQMWVTTTRPPFTTRSGAANLPNVAAQVDAAYDIPASGAVYILTGQRYLVLQGLRLNIGTIYELGLPSHVRQVDAAMHVGEYGKTFFFVGDFYYRYDERRRRMDPGFPRLIRADWTGIPRRVDAAFKLEGSIFLISGAKSYQYDVRQNRLLNVLSANPWSGC